MSRSRDNSYYLGVIKRDHPAVYGELIVGLLPNVRQARLKAGLLKTCPKVETVKRAFDRLSDPDKLVIAAYAAARTPSVAPAAPMTSITASVVGVDGKLNPTAIPVIQAEVDRCDGPGRFAREVLKLSVYNVSLAYALRGGVLRNLATISALQAWYAGLSSP